MLLSVAQATLYSDGLSPAVFLILEILAELLIDLRKVHFGGVDGGIISEGSFEEERVFLDY